RRIPFHFAPAPIRSLHALRRGKPADEQTLTPPHGHPLPSDGRGAGGESRLALYGANPVADLTLSLLMVRAPANPSAAHQSGTTWLSRPAWPKVSLQSLGSGLVRFLLAVQALGAFGLISLGVLFSKFGVARPILHPLILQQISRAGLRLLPLATFLAIGLGLIVIGQTVSV